MFDLILLLLGKISLQAVGAGAPSITNPYFTAFMLGIIVIITILGIRVYIIDKRKERRSQRRV